MEYMKSTRETFDIAIYRYYGLLSTNIKTDIAMHLSYVVDHIFANNNRFWCTTPKYFVSVDQMVLGRSTGM